MSHKNKLTTHAKLRFSERLDEPREKALSLSRSAMRKGLVWHQVSFIDSEFMKTEAGKELKSYMYAAFNRRKKYYKGYIYIFPKCSNRLITVYPVKPEFQSVLDKYWKKIYIDNYKKKGAKRK